MQLYCLTKYMLKSENVRYNLGLEYYDIILKRATHMYIYTHEYA
jgi:hypothetical protein